MVKIRLMRVGKKKHPAYRVVVADSRMPRDGRIIEAIGHYNPRHEPSTVSIDSERATYWIGKGAQPSAAVKKLLEINSGASSQPAAPAKTAVRATPAASVSESDRTPESAPGESELDIDPRRSRAEPTDEPTPGTPEENPESAPGGADENPESAPASKEAQ